MYRELSGRPGESISFNMSLVDALKGITSGLLVRYQTGAALGPFYVEIKSIPTADTFGVFYPASSAIVQLRSNNYTWSVAHICVCCLYQYLFVCRLARAILLEQ